MSGSTFSPCDVVSGFLGHHRLEWQGWKPFFNLSLNDALAFPASNSSHFMVRGITMFAWQGGGGVYSLSCVQLCDPINCSPPGSSVHGVSQARTLEWVAISFSRGSSRPRDWTWVSCINRWIFFFTVESPGEPHLAGWRYLKWWSESSERTTEQVLTYLTQKWKCVSLDLRLLGARSFMHLAELQKLSYWLFSDIDILNLRGPGPSNQEGGTLQEPEELNKPCLLSPPYLLSLLSSLQASILHFPSHHNNNSNNNNKPSFW